MKLTTSISESPEFEWDLGTDLAIALLEGINTITKHQSLKRLDGEDFKMYRAGEILRIDIPLSSVE